MVSKVLLDTNVLLDVLLHREPWLEQSSRVWNAHTHGLVEGYVTAVGLTNISHVLCNLSGQERARKAVRACLATFSIAPVDREALLIAAALSGEDFEGNVQAACAQGLGLDAIVSRETSRFPQTSIPVLTPAELLDIITRRNQE